MKMRLILISIILTLASCKREDLQLYSEQARIYFNLSGTFYAAYPGSTATNVLVDFTAKNTAVTQVTIPIVLRVTGAASTSNRSYAVFRSDGGLAKRGVDYDFVDNNFSIDAGAYTDTLKLIVYRKPELARTAQTFSFRLQTNENFNLGPAAEVSSFGSSSASVRILELQVTLSDILLKPNNWDSFIATYFGGYSEVRFRFVIDTLGLKSFASTLTATTMSNYRTRLRNALRSYNAANPGGLKDENGNAITF